MISKIEKFYHHLRHNESIEEQIQRSGIINSYILTTKTAMNQRRVAHLCLWCEEIWSDGHKCVNKPSYNYMFSFGEDDEGFAFVMVTKEALKPSSMNELQEEVVPLSKNHPLEEIGEPDPCIPLDWTVISNARQMFDEMPIPDFILEMAQLAKTSQVEFEGCDHEIGIDEVHYDQLPENQGSVVRSSEVLWLNNENDDTNQGKNGEIQVGDQCSNPSFSLVDEVFVRNRNNTPGGYLEVLNSLLNLCTAPTRGARSTSD
ncbi:hypothetical protein RND81_01G059000 [Saponaria officinalis]|uniref:Uncharacterized protein n=1 Tax=Saponaria officinalis TaxID=3572 RepID=A0AAW1NCE2_SAPOF